jgi:hypothetical protein
MRLIPETNIKLRKPSQSKHLLGTMDPPEGVERSEGGYLLSLLTYNISLIVNVPLNGIAKLMSDITNG